MFALALATTFALRQDRPPDRGEIDALVTRVASESAVVTNDYLARAEISARLLAGSLPAVPDIDSQLVLFANIIHQSEQIDGIYVGRDNGDFHLVARWTTDDAPSTEGPSPLRSRVIRQTPNGRETTERWFDADLGEQSPSVVSQAEYDPRERPWFVGATGSELNENWSDPYVFFSSNQLGITYSVAVDDRGDGATVVGADIVLDDLIAFLDERLPTPGSLALVLDRSGTVLAASGLTTEVSTTEAVDPRILQAVASEAVSSGSSEPLLVRLESEDVTNGEGSIAAVAPVGALDKWSLVVVAPEAELVVTSTVSAGKLSTVLTALAIAFLTTLIVIAAAYVLRLRSAARTDALTGLLSRYEIVRRLTGPLSRGQSSGALAIIDLNRFKQVNDVHGHGIGDFVLRETARRIAANVPRSATVGRLGGDEFIVVFSLEANPINQLKIVLAALAEPITVGRRTIETGGSAGVTFFNEREPTQLRRVLREADLALYASKADEASSVRIFNRSMEPTEDTTAEQLVHLSG